MLHFEPTRPAAGGYRGCFEATGDRATTTALKRTACDYRRPGQLVQLRRKDAA